MMIAREAAGEREGNRCRNGPDASCEVSILVGEQAEYGETLWWIIFTDVVGFMLPRFGPEPWFEPDRSRVRFVLFRSPSVLNRSERF